MKSLTTVIQEIGNPFQEESADLLVLDTKNIADSTLAEMVATHHQRGKEQFQSFMQGIDNETEPSFYHPIKKNPVSFFKQEPTDRISREKVLIDDCHLFSRLHPSVMVANGDAIIIDGSALVNALPPRTCTSKTFSDYAREDIIPKIERYNSKYKGVDIIVDVYRISSLKAETMSKGARN